MKDTRTPMITLFDKMERVISKGVLVGASVPIVTVDTIADMIKHKRVSKKSLYKVEREMARRLNKGEGRGRHYPLVYKIG